MAHKFNVSKIFAALLSISFLLVAAGGVPAEAAKDNGVEISNVGQQAFKDLSTCLTSGKSKALDVFYLVDSSGSLSYTDEKEVRRTVLENSVAQLKNFSDQGVKVSFAGALFSDSVKPIQSWLSLKSQSSFDKVVSLVTDSVNNSNVGGYTDWEEGLEFARKAIVKRSAENCKMLVWLTDGGINPTGDSRDTLASLKRLCHPSISSNSLRNPTNKFGIFSKLRQQKISIFGVLYQNDKSSFEQFDADYKDGSSDFTADERLELEHYLMSYMTPLVEGSGVILDSQVASDEGLPPGGPLQCAPVDEVGFAPVGQPNGAFLRAVDPVALAFQFLKMQAVLAGGTGHEIRDGKFEVPKGAVAFRLLTTSPKWSLQGPSGSNVSASSSSSGKTPNLSVSKSAGVYQIDFRVGSDPDLLGTWSFDAPKGDSEVYLFSGLTMVLDRDKTSQVVSERANTLTGQVIRTSEFKGVPVDLQDYDAHNISLSTLDGTGNLVAVKNTKIDVHGDGSFKVEGYVPDPGMENASLWLTLDLGGQFDPVTSTFDVAVVAKSDIATVSSDVIKLSDLVGPHGKATGEILVNGPSTVDSSTYCLNANALRTDDAQTAAQKHPRVEKFVWKFDSQIAGSDPICFEVAQGEVRSISVEVSNPTQADSHVVSVRSSLSTSGAATLDENLQFEFDSKAKSDKAVELSVIIGLLIAGLLLPLGLLYLMNWLTTKFLPVTQMVRAEYAVKIQTGPSTKILDQSGSPILVDANDFKFVPDQPGSKSLDLGSKGRSVARLPLFPLAAPWFEHQAPIGSRVISIYSGGAKSPNLFVNGVASEVSPNHADNWQLVIPESEFAKSEGEVLAGTLVIGARMAGLPQYQARVNDIASKPGLQRRLGEIRAAIRFEAEAGKKNGKSTGKTSKRGGDSSNVSDAAQPLVNPIASIPGVPSPSGVTQAPPSSIPNVPGAQAPSSTGTLPPSIPGVPKPPTIPGVTPPK